MIEDTSLFIEVGLAEKAWNKHYSSTGWKYRRVVRCGYG